MSAYLPLRLLHRISDEKGEDTFEVINPQTHGVREFDICTYTWGRPMDVAKPTGIPGVTWDLKINPQKLVDIQRLMKHKSTERPDGIEYLWADCVCINQEDKGEVSVEVVKMYQYYKSARNCYILMDMEEVWNPQQIVDDLKFIDHVLYHMGGAALAIETRLSENLIQRLAWWGETAKWTFDMDRSMVRAAAIDMGVLNCYATMISRVKSLFENEYFTRVWTFQEMILGKNIKMYGLNKDHFSPIGEFSKWMDLATDSKDKATKLHGWITRSRELRTASINGILRIIEDDLVDLTLLQVQVIGIGSARTDIINGGPRWWKENHKGVSNVFSAVSMQPRECTEKYDIFRGLLGIFDGLFSPEEIARDFSSNDVERMSFTFFKQLSLKTEQAWTKLSISSQERGESDWIPVVANSPKVLTTDTFAGVVNLGLLRPKGVAKAIATTGLVGTPRKYMRIQLKEDKRGFQFSFKGCNVGKNVSTGMFSSEPIPNNSQLVNISGDETGRILVQCATVFGFLMDPDNPVVGYRKRLLSKLQPYWHTSDPNAKPSGWEDRCVSGTGWENPDPFLFRVHNRSMNFMLGAMFACGSRLQNDTTAGISCEVRVNCGCIIVAPFSLVFEAITAVQGSFLGDSSARLEKDRIILSDGLGLVQVGDVGRGFNLVATGGDIDSHKSYASACRSTKINKPVMPKLPWPTGRAMVREEFTHGLTDSMRDYGYVDTGGSGNLLICRNSLLGQYKIIGVCIDSWINNKGGEHTVTIR